MLHFGYGLFTFSSVSVVKVGEWLQDYQAVSLHFSDTSKDISKASVCDTNMFRVLAPSHLSSVTSA